MKFVVFRFLSMITLASCFVIPLFGQSSDQNFPTPVTTSEIGGTVKARDMGDARLTTYFYAFNGTQGDIFINVTTKNFSGDIDVFNAEGLQLLTKMVIYADADVSETGRLVYLRKPEKLLLRIEGRSPNDEAATFKIRFGGSFVALSPSRTDQAPKVGPSANTRDSAVRVNSVGTIIETQPKPQKGKKIDAENTDAAVEKKAEPVAEKVEETVPVKTEEPKTDETKTETVFENPTAKVTVEPPPTSPAKRPVRAPARTSRNAKVPPKKAEAPPAELKPDPLANVRLVVQLKDGTVIERLMSEVSRFNVVNGVLTVTGKDGKVTRHSILDIAKVTIE